jgi:CDP-4-dehydro-6-deoxyglucose reductase
MTYKIEIQPAGIYFNAAANDSILDSALIANIHLEHSSKNWQCGVCSAELIEGCTIDATGNEYSSGSILTCCTKPQTDRSYRL